VGGCLAAQLEQPRGRTAGRPPTDAREQGDQELLATSSQTGAPTTGMAMLPDSWMVDMAIQPNGKILTLGSDAIGPSFGANYLSRLDPSGTLDASFGQGGIAPLPPAAAPRLMMAIQPGHGILIGGNKQELSASSRTETSIPPSAAPG